ncbi:hypothetical protein ScPMuIL_014444 [Solemya velum]
MKEISLDNKILKLFIWDKTGLDCWRAFKSIYYKKVEGIIIVYDVTNKESFDSLEHLLDEIEYYKSARGDAAILVIGNKCDLTTEKVVNYQTAKEFCDLCGLMLVETSAKTSTNVEQSFMTLVARIVSKGTLF